MQEFMYLWYFQNLNLSVLATFGQERCLTVVNKCLPIWTKFRFRYFFLHFKRKSLPLKLLRLRGLSEDTGLKNLDYDTIWDFHRGIESLFLGNLHHISYPFGFYRIRCYEWKHLSVVSLLPPVSTTLSQHEHSLSLSVINRWPQHIPHNLVPRVL